MRNWLDDRRVPADGLVWCEGWPEWKNSTEVFPQLSASTAPLPTATPAPAVASAPEPLMPQAIHADGGSTTKASAVDQYHQKKRRRTASRKVAILITLAVTVLILFGVLIWIVYHPLG